jgi:hypothetical protein
MPTSPADITGITVLNLSFDARTKALEAYSTNMLHFQRTFSPNIPLGFSLEGASAHPAVRNVIKSVNDDLDTLAQETSGPESIIPFRTSKDSYYLARRQLKDLFAGSSLGSVLEASSAQKREARRWRS